MDCQVCNNHGGQHCVVTIRKQTGGIEDLEMELCEWCLADLRAESWIAIEAMELP